jgi:hypothetical protein
VGVGLGEECLKLFKKAVDVVSRDSKELGSEPTERLLERYNELRAAQERYEEECAQHLTFSQSVSDIGFFLLARLKLASALKKASLPDAARGVVEDFTDEEYKVLERFEEFAALDFVTSEEIASSLLNRRGEIYYVVKNWYGQQMYEYEKLLGILEKNGRVKERLAAALRQVYRKRFERIRDGIVRYMEMDPAAPRLLFKEYEEVLLRLGEAELERRGVEERLKEALATEYAKELDAKVDELRGEVDKLIAVEPGSIDPSRLESVGRAIGEVISMIKDRLLFLEESRKRVEGRLKELTSICEKAGWDTRLALEAEIGRLKETGDLLAKKLEELSRVVSALEAEKMALERLEPKEGPLVTKEEARMLEIVFIERFDRKVRGELPKTFHLRNEKIVVRDAKDLLRTSSDETYLLKDVYGVVEKDLAVYPHNTRVIYTVTKKRLFDEDLRVVIEAAYLSHLQEYVKRGYDVRPVSLHDFLRFFDRVFQKAQLGQILHVIGIGSPTGFDDSLKKYISSKEFGRSFVANYVSVCLVDLLSGEVIYNEADGVAKLYKGLFELELEEEKLLKVRRYVEEQRWLSRSVGLSKVVSELGVDSIHVKRVFYQLQAEGVGKVYKVDGEEVFRFVGEEG